MVARPQDLRVDGYGIDPQFPVDESLTLRGVTSVDANVVHGSRLGHRIPRGWILTWDGSTEGQQFLLRRAFSAVGVYGVMNFLPPDGGGIVEVMFMGPLETERTSATAWRMSVEVEELLR